jgi:NAD(P)-dependent dehydrogenase (short-subunit alcohol dehydrogenase family)
LINNALAAGLVRKHAHRIEQDIYNRGFHENILPLLRLTHQAIKLFRKQKFGKIITVLSSGLVGVPPSGMAEYLASKAYLLSMSKSWASENRQFNITANCISPDFMQTPLNADVDERLVEQMVEAHPLKQLITPEEVAEVVSFMIQATQHMNGTNLILNAGSSMS